MATHNIVDPWRVTNSRWFGKAQQDVARLQQLGVNVDYLAKHYSNSLTSEDINDLLNGVLYLKEKYPHIWSKNSSIIEVSGAGEEGRK